MKTIYLKPGYTITCDNCKDELKRPRTDDDGNFYCYKCMDLVRGKLTYAPE